MALSLARKKQNAKAFQLVFHEERFHGQARAQAPDRVQDTVAQAQDRFGNQRLSAAMELSPFADVGGLDTDTAAVAGDVGFLHDQLTLSLVGFDTGLLGVEGSNAAMQGAMEESQAGAAEAALRDAQAVDYDANHPAVRNMHNRGGQPLPAAVAARLGAAFGHDFAHVRVHTDANAAQAAEALNARAFAIGSEIWFGRGAWNPGTSAGDQLLAHELTHVVQHDEGRLPSPAGPGLNVSSPTDTAEREAYANEKSIVAQLGTASTTALADAPLSGEGASPTIEGVSLGVHAAETTESTAGVPVEGMAMRDFLPKRSGRPHNPRALLPGLAAAPPPVKGLLDKAGVDPAARPDSSGPGLDGEVKAPQDLLNHAARNVPGLSGVLKPADMDVVDRNGNRPASLIAGDGLNVRVHVGNAQAGLNLNANLGGKGGNNVSVDGHVADGPNRLNVRGQAGDGGNSLAIDGKLSNGDNTLAVNGKVGDGGNALSADASIAKGLVNVSATADKDGVKVDLKADKLEKLVDGDKEKKKGEKDEDEEKDGEGEKKGKEGDEKKGADGEGAEGGAEGADSKKAGSGAPGGAKGDGAGAGEGAPGGLGGADTEVSGGGPGALLAARGQQGGVGEARSLGNLVLPQFKLEKDAVASLKKKTGLTPEQHQQQIQQHVDRIKSQADQMREGLRRYAEEKALALDLEVAAAKEALKGDIGTARGKISGAYGGARAALAGATSEGLGAVEAGARTARETLATSLPAQQAKLAGVVAAGRTKVDGLAPVWKKKFGDALEVGAKGFEKAAGDCATELAGTKATIVATWADAGDALQRAQAEASRKAASKGVDDAVADFRAGGGQKAAAARAQKPTYDSQVDSALQAVRDALTQMETQGKTALQGAHDRALVTITTQTTEAGTAIAAAKSRAEGALGSAEKAALGEVDSVQAQQEVSLTGAADAAKGSIGSASVSLRDRYAQWFDGVLRGVPKDQPTTYDQVREFLEGKERELPSFNAQVMGELDKSCEGARQTVVDASNAARSALARLADGQAASAANQGRQQADGIRATAAQFATGIRATGSAVETAFTQHVQPMQGSIDQRLTLTETSVTTALEAAKADLVAQATTYATQLRERITRMPQTLGSMANAAAAGVYRNLSDRAQRVHTACKGMGTDESGVYNALRGLTAIGGSALETVVWPRLFAAEGGLRAFIIDDMDESEQRIAFAYLGGNTALGARLELDASMHWYGDDEAQIEKILRELSPEDLAAMKADPQWSTTRARLMDNLDGTDLDVTRALIAGNVARADAYRLREKIDEARRSRDPDALADALAGVDPAQLAAVQQEFVNIQNKVDPEATNVPPVDPQLAATQLADYATRDIPGYDPNTGEQRNDSITGPNRDLVRALATQGRESVDAATARFEVERTRSGGPKMDRMETALMAPPDLQQRLHSPDPQVRAQAQQQQDQREAAMRARYQEQYGGPEGRTMDAAIRGITAGRTDKSAEIQQRLMQNMLADGTNSPRVAADMIALGAEGAGTDEAMIKRALTGMRPDEVQQMNTVYQQVHGESVYERLGVAERDANGNKISGRDHAANQWFNELSGDDRREVEMLLQGDPQYMTPQQQMALARTQYDWQRGSESGAMGRWMMDGSAEQKDLDRNFAALTTLNARMRPDGTFANPADQQEYERLCGDVGINAAQYQAANDRTANYITTGVAIAGAVAVTAATFGSGAPAGAAMIMAAAGTAASGAISMGVNAGMKGGRYGWEQAATDAGITAVNTLTAGAGAYMKGAQIGVGALGKVGSGVAIDAGMGFVNGAAQTAMTDGTWDQGFMHGLGEVGIGGARQALTDGASSAVSGAIDETKLGQAIQRSGDIWHNAVFKGASNAAGGAVSALTGIGFDAARGKFRGDLGDVAERVGTESAKQFVMGAAGGALGGAIRTRRGNAAGAGSGPPGAGGDPPPPGSGVGARHGPDNNNPPNNSGGGAAVDTSAPRTGDTGARPTGSSEAGTTNRPPGAPSQDPHLDATTGRAPAGTQVDAATAAQQRAARGEGGGQNDTGAQVVRDTNSGESTVTTPKGVTHADDSGVVTKNRDGTTDFVDSRGNLTHTSADGTSHTLLTDGTAVVRDPGGAGVAVKDETVIRLDAQGRPAPDPTPQRPQNDAATREQAVFDRVDQLVREGKMSHAQAWEIVARSGDVHGQETALRAAEQARVRDDAVIERLVALSGQKNADGTPVVRSAELDAVIDAKDPLKALQFLEARVANQANDLAVRQQVDAATKVDGSGGGYVDRVYDNITVGAGFAGISNEVSARSNGARGERLVVGGENPWMQSRADLGQRAGESEVVGGARPMASTSETADAKYMAARQHAENVEINRAGAGVGVLRENIDGVELRSQMPPGTAWHKDAAARIRVSDGVSADGTPKFKYIYANHVDIASGPGKARELSTQSGPDGRPPQIDPALYAQLKRDGQILHSDQGFHDGKIREGDKVVVFGAGAAGAWGVEGAYRKAGEVEWLGRMAKPNDEMPAPQRARLEGMYERLNAARTSGDMVAAQRAMTEIERFTFTEARGNGFLPRNQREGAAFDPNLQSDAGGKITRSVTEDVRSVSYETNPETGKQQLRIVGSDGKEVWADRLVLAIGQDGEKGGGPGQLLGQIRGMTPLVDSSGREFPFPVVVGVESADGAVRVIGAAATSPAVRKRIEMGYHDMVNENFMLQSTHSSVPTDSNGVVGSFHHAERMIRQANKETLIRLAQADGPTQQRIIGGHDEAWSAKVVRDNESTRHAPELPPASPRTGNGEQGAVRPALDGAS
jgi:hypothetical protein